MICLSGTSASIWPEPGWHTLIFSMMPWNIYKVKIKYHIEVSQLKHLEYKIKVIALILKAPITTAADDKFCKIFPNFQKK